MADILFARPRQPYQSYTDLFRIIDLSGFPLVYIDEVDWDKPQTVIGVIKHPEWSIIPAAKTARCIWWTFERMLHVDELDMASPVVPACVDETWCSDRAIAAQYGFRYVFLGGVESFTALTACEKQYDLITLMYWSHRRQPLRGQLSSFSVADWQQGYWGAERDRKIAQSRLLFSAHQDDQPWCEPIKFALAGMYAIPLLSETCADSGYWVAGQHYFAAPFERMADYAHMLLRSEHATTLARVAANAWRLVCRERPFRKTVLEAVGERVTA